MTLRTVVNSAVGLALVGGISYCVYGYATAQARVRAECAEIQIGSNLASLEEFARAHGLNGPSGAADVIYLGESRTFGRYACKVRMKDGAVQTAQYDFAG
jgi:hypothetical protein